MSVSLSVCTPLPEGLGPEKGGSQSRSRTPRSPTPPHLWGSSVQSNERAEPSSPIPTSNPIPVVKEKRRMSNRCEIEPLEENKIKRLLISGFTKN